MSLQEIQLKGAREHNLRDVSLTLPKGKLVCFTGVSGSGKSSLAFDTLFAEGQRRYLESLSSYARQFLGQLAKPDVDHITGLSPSISIQQKTSGWNPRSTVGTITQIHDYLRVLYARVGKQHCPTCGAPITAQTREQILSRILDLPTGVMVMILAPVARAQKGEFRDLFDDMVKQGFARARVDGSIVALGNAPALKKNARHDIEIVVDRLTLGPDVRARLAEAVESALNLGKGSLIVHPMNSDSEPKPRESGRLGANAADKTTEVKSTADLLFSSQYACATCGVSFEPPSPQLFSFNSPTGMCATCDGLGECFDFDPDLCVPDPSKPFPKAIAPMRLMGKVAAWRKRAHVAVSKHFGFDLKQPWAKLPERAKQVLLHGLGKNLVTFAVRKGGYTRHYSAEYPGVLAEMRDTHRRAKSEFLRAFYEKYMRRSTCGACAGSRLNPQALAVKLAGKNIHEACELPVRDAMMFFSSLQLEGNDRLIAADVLREVAGRLSFLVDVGLDYLTLNRAAPTLSGGESQRIRLASQIGAGLVGVLYILDEPSIGLHPRDNQRLLDSLRRLRDLGNTVIVVEHDEQTMRTADVVVDFGPGPGVRGGEVVAHGSIEDVMNAKRSLTGKFLRGEETIEVPKERRPVGKNPAGSGKASPGVRRTRARSNSKKAS